MKIQAFLLDGLHCREQDHIADGACAGEEHDAAVNADPEAARGGHPVLQGVDEILVHHAGLVVALGAQLDLLLEALLLVDGVVELGEGVAHLAAADEELEALGQARVLRAALGKGRDIHRVHGDEGGLDHLLLHLLVEALIERVAPGGLHLVHIDADSLCCGDSLRIVRDGHEVHAEVLLHGLGHGEAAEARSQGDLVALPLDIVGAEDLHRRTGEKLLEEVHHVVEVGIGLIELDGGKLRVMLGVHALIAKLPADLVHALNAADDEALEIELGGDAQEHVDIEGVVMRDEGPRGGAAGDGVEDRGLDLHIAAPVQIAADIGDEAGADLKITAGIVVHDEVHIALAVLELGIGHAVELLGQRAQGLGEQHHGLHMHGDFAGLGLEDIAADPDDVADIILAEIGKLGLAHSVGADIELDEALVVLDMAEDGLAHAALGHDAPGHADLLFFKSIEVVLDLLGPGRAAELCLPEGVAPLLLQSGKLIAPYLQDFGKLHLGSLLIVSLFAHVQLTPITYFPQRGSSA